jgi:hypothetical protein
VPAAFLPNAANVVEGRGGTKRRPTQPLDLRPSWEHGMQTQQQDRALTAKWGLRPRHYAGALDPADADDWKFIEAVRDIASFINECAQKNHSEIAVDPWEIACNALLEGFWPIISQHLEWAAPYSTYDNFGADTVVTKFDDLKPWLHPCVVDAVKNNPRWQHLNDGLKPEMVIDLQVDAIQGLYANAGCYAWAKNRFALDLCVMGRHPISIRKVSPSVQVYFATMYYNTRLERCRRFLKRALQNGAFGHPRWTGSDVYAEHLHDPAFNAAMRASTYDHIRAMAPFVGKVNAFRANFPR